MNRRGRAAVFVLAAPLLAGLAGGAHAAEAGCPELADGTAAVHALDVRTLELDDGRRIRVAGLEPFGLLVRDKDVAETRLKERLSALLGQKPVRVSLTSEGTDRYGRFPALVSSGDTLVQQALAREGLAVAFAGGDALPCFGRILAAEAAARRAGLGFWADVTVPRADPEALGQRIGRFAIFEGRVVSVGNRSTRTYLNFGTTWSEDVTVEIAARDRKHFGGEAGLAALSGRTVRVRGFLQDKAGPMLEMRSSMQMEILDPGPDISETGGAP